MNQTLLELLMVIAEATSSNAYLESQNAALEFAQLHEKELVEIARNHEQPKVRIEAMGIIFLAEFPIAKPLFEDLYLNDNGQNIKNYARHYLYRIEIAKNAREIGNIEEDNYKSYKESARRTYAQELFK
jgi:hypothetical protein